MPTLIFLGVPLFALFLKIFYLGSGRFYVEHLIFSLHLHIWFFLVIMVGNGYLKLAAFGPGWQDNLCAWTVTLWALWYFFRSFRVVFSVFLQIIHADGWQEDKVPGEPYPTRRRIGAPSLLWHLAH